MELLAAALATGTAFVLVYSLVTPDRRALAFLERLNRHERSFDPARAAVLAQPFGRRAMRPLTRRGRQLLRALLPASVFALLERWLVLAGEPVSAAAFLAVQGAVAAVSGFLAVVIVSQQLAPGATAAVLAACAAVAATPLLWLRLRVRRRKASILRALPDAVDLVVTSVEAGLAIDGALAEVARDTYGPLGDELRMAIRETTLGRSRREALLGVVERTEVRELRAFIHSLIQAEHTGVPIGQVLRSQAAHVRLRRRQRAEAQAQRAPVKMVVVLVVLVLPAMLLTIVGPALLRIADSI